MEYEVYALDADGYEICPTGVEYTKAEAIKRATQTLSDKELKAHKVEVCRDGECVWDRFS